MVCTHSPQTAVWTWPSSAFLPRDLPLRWMITPALFFVCMCMLLFLLISFWDIITALYFVYRLLCCKTVISLRNTETCLNSACSKVHLERIHSMTWELKVCPQHTNLTDWLEQVDPVTPLDANTACLRHDYTSYRSAAVKQGVAKWISQTRVQFSSVHELWTSL